MSETATTLKTLLGALVTAYYSSDFETWKDVAHQFNNTVRRDADLPEVKHVGESRRVLAISRYGVGQVQLMDSTCLVSISSVEVVE